MNEHLSSASWSLETENSQRSNGKDEEMENTNNATIERDTLLVYRQTQWQYRYRQKYVIYGTREEVHFAIKSVTR